MEIISMIVYNIIAIICYTIAVIVAKKNPKAGRIWFWVGLANGIILIFGGVSLVAQGSKLTSSDLFDWGFFGIITVITLMLLPNKQDSAGVSKASKPVEEDYNQQTSYSYTEIPVIMVQEEEQKGTGTGKNERFEPIAKVGNETPIESETRRTSASDNDVVFRDTKTYIQGNLPLAVSNIRIIKKTDSEKPVLTFDLTSSAVYSVVALMVGVECFSVWGEVLTKENYQVIDLKTATLRTAHNVASIALDNTSTRQVKIEINKVAFSNGTNLLRTGEVFPTPGDISYKEYLSKKEAEKELQDKKEKVFWLYRQFYSNDSEGFVRTLNNSSSVFEIAKRFREMTEKYPGLFPDSVITKVREASRKQSAEGGDHRAEAANAIMTYLNSLHYQVYHNYNVSHN